MDNLLILWITAVLVDKIAILYGFYCHFALIYPQSAFSALKNIFLNIRQALAPKLSGAYRSYFAVTLCRLREY